MTRTAAPPLQRFGKEENRCQGGAEIVSHLDNEFHSVGSGQAIGEMAGPVGLHHLVHPVRRGQEPEGLGGRNLRRGGGHLAQQPAP